MAIRVSLDILQYSETESAVLGAVLLNNSVMDDIGEMLEPRDFHYTVHQLIWEAMKYQHSNNKPCDIITLTDILLRYERIEEIGGINYLRKLVDSCPTSSNVMNYAEIVQRRSYRKRAVEAAEKIMKLSQDDYGDDEQFFSELEKAVLSVRPSDSGTMRSIADSKRDYMTYLDTKDDFIFTGFQKFDEWMGGIGRGWLYILAGRPSVGKTAKMLQMATGIAEQNVGQILIWSQEMKRNQLFNRMLAPMTGIGGNRIRKKELDDRDKKRLSDAFEQLEQMPIHIEDSKNVTIEEVRATARNIKRKYGKIGAIIVDYLTIMNIKQQKGESRSQAVGYVTRTAKSIALELDCPFIMLAQLSRDGKDEPKLEHLRDSGEIEQDADVVEFLWHNPDITNPNGKVIQSVIAKGRDIGVNNFEYLFQGWIQKYTML